MAFGAAASLAIEAPADTVWSVLTDVDRWSEWCTWLRWIGGAMEPGKTVQIELTPPEGTGWAFKATVLAASDGHLAWITHTGVAGVMDGEHHFRVEPDGPDRCVLHNTERYSGLLSPLARRMPQMQGLDASFDAMNREVKVRAEALAR